MKKIVAVSAVGVALFAIQSSVQATIVLSGSTGLVNAQAPNGSQQLDIAYTVDLTGSTYTYTYFLTSPAMDNLSSFTIGSPTVPIYTPTIAISSTGYDASDTAVAVGADVTYSAVGANSIVWNFKDTSTSESVAFTSSYFPGSGVWGILDDSVTWNNPPLIPAPVPEASTIAAGALMLLPLGLGAFRALRRERVA